jgi:hypothetical protein
MFCGRTSILCGARFSRKSSRDARRIGSFVFGVLVHRPGLLNDGLYSLRRCPSQSGQSESVCRFRPDDSNS